MPPLRVLVTGPPGCGKTTLCTGVRDRLQGRALPTSGGGPRRGVVAPELGAVKYLDKLPFLLLGFLTHERRNSAGKRVAFDLVSLDGSQQACLASVDGPDTGRRMGQYHVQTGWEPLACDILDKALGASGSPRAVIFDEIGKMELNCKGYVQRVESLLNSTDANLHVLGTVALNGPGLISESKRLQGVEVVELSNAARDRQQVEIAERFIEALSGEADGAAASAFPTKLPGQGGDIDLTGEAAPGSEPPAAAAAPPRATFDIPPKGEYSAVYLAAPAANFASLNAGDYLLYVGGKQINWAFAEAMKECGQTPAKRYEVLHKALMGKAGRRGARGKLAWLAEEDVPPGVFDDTIAFCGLLPEGRGMERLEPVGLSSIAVFPASRRPCGSERNVAMVYTVGPNCGGIRKVKGPGQSMTKAEFLEVMEAVGHGVASAVTQYNSAAGSRDLPSIEILRICLVSGGVYKHPGASKLDVATSLIRGLLAGSSEGSPTLDFAWDDDVFQTAWRGLGLPGAGSSSTAEPGDQGEPVERRVEPRVERRVDPANGRAYALAELESYYSGSYSKEEIRKYWEETCQRVEASPHGSGGGGTTPDAARGGRGRWRAAK